MLLLLITLLTACTLTDSTSVVDSGLERRAYTDGVLERGGARAQLVSFERAGCEACDACRETYLCAPCFEDCDVCDLGCDAECVERVEVLVPSLPPGPALIEVFNGEGASGRLTLTVLAPPEDTGGADCSSSCATT